MLIVKFLCCCAAHLAVDNYESTLFVRAVAGMAAAGLSSCGILYLIQAFPAAHRLKGLILGIGASSFAIPMARLFSPQLIQMSEWRGFYIFELGLSLVCLAAVMNLRMPPSQHLRTFERLDFLTFALFAPGVACLTVVLGLGRVVWWTQAPWLGWCLIGAIVLLTAALAIEHNRKNPLINTRWLAGPDIIRLGLSILLVRMVLSEQTSGAVGFLQVMGLTNDQFHGLFFVILAATAAGTAVSAFTLNMEKLNKPIAIALGLIAIGAFIDSHSTVLTRPAQLYFSQALIAFASAMFIGPALMIGISRVIQQGKQNLISFIVMFSVLQNVGGLAGSALTGSLQIVREKFHSNQLAADITSLDPQVVLRLRQLSGAYSSTITDPALLNAEGIDASGPHPADTVFFQAVHRGRYDAIVCMYHDQGHAPMKLIAFDSGVNVTLGLPVVRTSVDHGTAFDIAWRGVAFTESLEHALQWARKLTGAVA